MYAWYTYGNMHAYPFVNINMQLRTSLNIQLVDFIAIHCPPTQILVSTPEQHSSHVAKSTFGKQVFCMRCIHLQDISLFNRSRLHMGTARKLLSATL